MLPFRWIENHRNESRKVVRHQIHQESYLPELVSQCHSGLKEMRQIAGMRRLHEPK